MLAKLIKYDLKFIFKTVNIYLILLFLSVILHNVTSYDYTPVTFDISGQTLGGEPDAPILIQFLHTVFYNAIIAMLIGLVLNSIIRIWGRFKYNMYGDESYLTHTLPVSRKTLWLSKFLSLSLTILGVIAGIGISFWILSFVPTGRNLIGSLGFTEQAPFNYTVALLIGLCVEMVFITLCGITGIIIGHRANSHRGLRSIIFGFIIYGLSAILLLGFLVLWSNVDPDIQNLFDTTISNPHEIFTFDFITKLFIGIDLAYIVMIATLASINYLLLKSGVDVD